MRENTVKHACLAGRVQVGSFIATSDSLVAQIMANSGFEWVLVDMEHGPVPLTALQAAVTAIRTTPTQPFVRAAWNSSAAIQTALDCGVAGIMVPMISTQADAEQIVRDARYLPLGERSRGGFLPILSFGCDSATYRDRSNEEVLLMAQIETAEGVENLEAIAGVEGIDCLFAGPNDLASSYGLSFPHAWDNKTAPYYNALAEIPKVARKHGKIAGIQANNPAMANACIELGYTLVGVGADAGFLWAAARKTRAEVNATA
jgi:4-hydroxy-2-oxoheptanedioate aldolase